MMHFGRHYFTPSTDTSEATYRFLDRCGYCGERRYSVKLFCLGRDGKSFGELHYPAWNVFFEIETGFEDLTWFLEKERGYHNLSIGQMLFWGSLPVLAWLLVKTVLGVPVP
jgi:hypothetical protein